MTTLTTDQQAEIQGGKWGFLCGAAVVLGIGGSIASGGTMVGPAMLAAEWACTLDFLMDQ